MGRWFLVLVSAALSVHFLSYTASAVFPYVHVSVGILILLLNYRTGVWFYLVSMLLVDDTARHPDLAFATIHVEMVGPFSLFIYWTFVIGFLGVLLGVVQVTSRSDRVSTVDKAMIGMGILFTISAVLGVDNFLQYPRKFATDASYFVNMFIGYVAVRVFYRHPRKAFRLIIFIVLALGAKAFVEDVLYITGGDVQPGESIQPVLPSTRKLMGVALLTIMAMTWYWGRVRYRTKITMYVIGGACAFNLLMYASRGNMLFFGISLLILWLLFSYIPVTSGPKVGVRGVLAVALLSALLIPAVDAVRPGAADFLIWKLESTSEVGWSGSGRPSSVGVRVLEAINIFGHLRDNGALLWGTGLGGYFTDSTLPYAGLLINATAYSTEEILAGTLFRPHGTQLVMYLKTGVLGVSAYFFLWGVSLWEIVKRLKRIEDLRIVSVVGASVAAFPVFMFFNFTSIIQVLSGAMIAAMSAVSDPRVWNIPIHLPVAGTGGIQKMRSNG